MRKSVLFKRDLAKFDFKLCPNFTSIDVISYYFFLFAPHGGLGLGLFLTSKPGAEKDDKRSWFKPTVNSNR